MHNRTHARYPGDVAWPLILLFALTGCAASSSAVRIDKEANADFSRCKSFAWLSPNSSASSLTDQRVRDAALQTLRAKGYTEAKDNPDCQVTYNLTTREGARRSGPSVGVGVGGGSGGLGGGIGVSLPIGKSKGRSGTFTMDIVDASRKAQIWTGSVDGTFENEISSEKAQALVDKVLKDYPPSGK